VYLSFYFIQTLQLLNKIREIKCFLIFSSSIFTKTKNKHINY